MSDYISREAAIVDFERCNYENPVWTPQRVKTLLMRIPAADVEPVRYGRWKPLFESEITGWNPAFAGCDPIGAYVCSCCNSEATYTCDDEFDLSNYYPNCGAKMGLENNDENRTSDRNP